MSLEDKPWGLRAIAFVGGAILLSVTAGTLGVFAAFKQGWIEENDLAIAETLMQGVSFYLAGALILWLFLRNHAVTLNQAFGLDRQGLRRMLRLAVLLFLVVIPLVWSINFIWREVLLALGIPPNEQDILKLVRRAKSPVVRAYFVFMAVVLAPVVEEGLFRGFIYPAVKRHVGLVKALVIVSLLFAAVHHNVGVFGPLVVLALLLGLSYEVTGNLIVPITIHSLFNLTNLVVLIFLVER
jgi:membrane protease YdiL (CAAX protease family)